MKKKCIALTDAEEGMVLSRAVTNEKGMTLCAEGTPLTGDLIDRFKQMAVTEIYIENNEELSEEDYAVLNKSWRRDLLYQEIPILSWVNLKLCCCNVWSYEKALCDYGKGNHCR